MFENEWNPDRVDEYEAADRKVKDACIVGIETHLELIGGVRLFWMEVGTFPNRYYKKPGNWNYLKDGECLGINICKNKQRNKKRNKNWKIMMLKEEMLI